MVEKYRELRNNALSVGRVRTYNFTNGTVKDHRTNITASLKDVLNGKIELLR